MERAEYRAEYVDARPHPALAGLVRRYVGYVEHSTTPVRRRQAPVGALTLIISFGPPLRMLGPAGPSAPGSFLAGLHDAVVLTEFVGLQRGVQVDLTPLGGYTLLGRPMDELVNRAPALDELAVPELARLPERLAEDPGWPQRFARVDAALLGLLAAAPRLPDPEVRWAWQRLQRTGGAAGVAELADGTGWSRRHLLTRFRAQVGLAPKAAARVVRFERAVRLLVPALTAGPADRADRTDRSIADVAARCGYADHAHLTREFRALAGVPPTAYVAEWQAAVPIPSSQVAAADLRSPA
ncbi:transcriptional regulator, AraC family [Pseudonocardia thermophila]|uniref:Transcriptional regulator, AraC family n=1 Tax=Pseudonocardia thermophila TaxID=1848 RepID=A0A1M6Z2I8_PSETH|nr:helix-turn-helix transcriptional regulator [Pseudonocardia thermophila]SHL24529.1 transcriptional regulator, AraC family [Pseudonocardia thermophila]